MNNEAVSAETVSFRLRCCICGHREVLEVRGGDPDGPSCTKCYGPMTVEGVSTVRRAGRSKLTAENLKRRIAGDRS